MSELEFVFKIQIKKNKTNNRWKAKLYSQEDGFKKCLTTDDDEPQEFHYFNFHMIEGCIAGIMTERAELWPDIDDAEVV